MASTTDINNFLSYILYSQSIYMDKINLRERLGHTGLFMWRLRTTILNNYVQMLMDYFPSEPEYGLITGWTNYNPNGFETFVSSGTTISSMINSAGIGLANSSAMDVEAGETITVELTLTMNSGVIPELYISNGVTSVEAALVAGLNIIELVPTWSGFAELLLMNNNGTDNVDCSITGVSVYRQPRKVSNNINNFMTTDEAQEVINRINRMCDSNYIIDL